MYVTRMVGRAMCLIALGVFVIGGEVWADQQAAQDEHAEHEAHAQHQHGGGAASTNAAEGSGTAWLPGESPMYAIHATAGGWQLMVHENAFLQFLHEAGPRGDDQTGSINWVMAMANRSVGRGTLEMSGMFSGEPWTIGGCGYPDLLASGEECDGAPIHDRQHPHDLFMELSASYDAPLKGATRWQIYGGPVGEPALGPVAFPHRVSAMTNPLAPITHHWMDSTHVTFGVVTGGVYGRSWKAEASVFNGREPDSDRTNFDFGALDSVSGRFWYLPTRTIALQVSMGRLTDAEASEAGEPRIDVTRVTASATYHRPLANNSLWATTVGWGRNAEATLDAALDRDHASNALLIETNLTIADRDAWSGRLEVVGKSAHDLVVPEPPEAFTVARVQGGYTRYLPAWNAFQPGLGAGISLSIVPESLTSMYGSRANAGFSVYATLRPKAHR
jgi:hypothetical protein